ncbi:MAG: hypothetical protein EXR27_15590 [Betaproteobacteria bacterium]|nr:hypothetical protein [Betaproteobacteria bacterium]
MRKRIKPHPRIDPAYIEAFSKIVMHVAEQLKSVPKGKLPIRMYIAGGAALQFHTGTRVSADIDAAFSARLALQGDMEVTYRGVDGTARILYLDRNYNDTLGLLHEDAHEDSFSIAIPGIDSGIIDIRILSPLDLAVSKVSRLSEIDLQDIRELALAGLIEAKALRSRAEEALSGYVGNLASLRGSIEIACEAVATIRKPRKR